MGKTAALLLISACLTGVLLTVAGGCSPGPASGTTSAPAPGPRSADEQKAVELARSYLEKQGLKWGEPKTITPEKEAGTFLLSYPTPGEEQKVLGDRAVTVDVRSGEVKLVPRD
jgi:hypothetical protein